MLNSAGNEIHWTGLSWAGHHGEPASTYQEPRDVLAASGALCAIRRSTWDALGGFHDEFFAYYEDAQLSLRCWQRGLRVVFEPAAVGVHRYEFSRRPQKMFLLERNRLLTLLTCYQRRTLVVLAPILALLELGCSALAVVQGWGREKIRSWGWLLRHRALIRMRRAEIQDAGSVRDRELAPRFSTTLELGPLGRPGWLAPSTRASASSGAERVVL